MVSATPRRSTRPTADGMVRAAVLVAPLVVAAAVLVIVWPGLMPGVGFWDTGEFQTVAPILGTAHPTGYPTYVILGYLVNVLLTPIGEPAFRMNVLSLLSIAVAAAATVALVARLAGSTVVGVGAGLALATTPIAWAVATRADPHSLHLAFVALLFAALVRWELGRRAGEATADRWLIASAILFGLSAGNHSLTLLLALPIGLYVLAVHPGILGRPRLIATCLAALVVPLVLVYLELPIRAGILRAPLVYAAPNTWDGFWYIALAEQFRGSLDNPLGDLPRKVGTVWQLAEAQLGLLAPVVALGFLATVVRFPRYALLTGSAMVITVLFNASYSNADIQRYYLGPIFWAWTWLGVLAGVVLEQVSPAAPESVAADVPDGAAVPDRAADPAVEAAVAEFSRSPRHVDGPLRGILAVVLAVFLLAPALSTWDHRVFAANRSNDTAARRWVDAALSHFEPDAVVVSWWSTSTVLWYATLVEGRRPDIMVVDDRTRLDRNYGEATDVIARFLETHPVYVIRANAHDLGLVLALYDLERLPEPTSNVYRVTGVRGAGA
jgi:hypothetical protein